MEGPRLLREFGSDRVVSAGDLVEVWSPRPITGWTPKKYRRLRITLDGVEGRFFVAELREVEGAFVHVLAPWPADLRDLPAGEVHYDAAFVAARDRTVEEAERAATNRVLLAIAGPVLGLLWSRSKQRLHDRHGLHPRRATHGSMWLEGIVLAILELFSMGTPAATWFVLGTLGLDLLFRGSSMLREDFCPLGLFEWPFAIARAPAEPPLVPLAERGPVVIEDDTLERKIGADLAHAGHAVGADRVYRQGDAFVVHASRPMPAWEARKYRKLAITIEGVRCHVVESDEAGGRARYRLEPWPRGFEDLPFAEVVYDEAFVTAREEEAVARSRTRRRSRALEAFTGPIGFVWSRTKRDLEGRYGISTPRATVLSIVIELAIAFLFATLGSIATDSSYWPFPPKILAGATVLFASDLVARVLVILRERGEWLGFWEWPVWLLRRGDPTS